MKKAFLFAIAMVGLLALSTRVNADSGANRSRVAYTAPIGLSNADTYYFMLTEDGHQVPGMNAQFDIGESSRGYRSIYAAQYRASSVAIVNVTESWTDLPNASTNAVARVTKTTTVWTAGGGVNLTTAAFVPRNLTFQMNYASVFSSNNITCSAVVIGTDSVGRYATETISFSTAQGVGNQAFAYASTVTVTCSSFSVQPQVNAILSIGLGSKIGLANDITAATDVYAVTVDTMGYSPTSQTFDAAHDTYTPSPTPNERYDYKLWIHLKKGP